ATSAATPSMRKRRSFACRRASDLSTASEMRSGAAANPPAVTSLILLTVFTDDVERDHIQAERDRKKRQTERKGDERLRAREIEIAGQLVDDGDRHRRDRLERIAMQNRAVAGGQHDDHGLADGAADGEQERTDNAG